MSKDLSTLLWENAASAAGISAMRRIFDAVKTKIPVEIATIKKHLDNTGEYEMYEFLENCEFWEVRNKQAPNWYCTAGVRVAEDRIEFYYDKDFIKDIARKGAQELIFLIAHEMSHILRFHEDRARAKNRDPSDWNIATDAIINDDIIKSKKVADFTMGKNIDTYKKGIQIPKEYHDLIEKAKVGRAGYNSDDFYDWMMSNNKNKEKTMPPPKEAKVSFEKGGFVKTKDGNYHKITEVYDDESFDLEPVEDINAEYEKAYG